MSHVINLDTVAFAAAIISLVMAFRRDHMAAILASAASLFCSHRSRAARRRRDEEE